MRSGNLTRNATTVVFSSSSLYKRVGLTFPSLLGPAKLSGVLFTLALGTPFLARVRQPATR